MESAGNHDRSYSSHLVGTSETTRVTFFEPEGATRRFNQWLAGLIDGDGCLLVSKAGYSSCEITVALADERMLRIIQIKLGGAIKSSFWCKSDSLTITRYVSFS